MDLRAVVLVEGASDQFALQALADRRGRNLEAEGVASGDVDVSVNGGSVDMKFATAPHIVKADVNGGAVDIRVPNDANRYRVETDTNGGATEVGIRTDPASDRPIDVQVNGGSVNLGYLAET